MSDINEQTETIWDADFRAIVSAHIIAGWRDHTDAVTSAQAIADQMQSIRTQRAIIVPVQEVVP